MEAAVRKKRQLPKWFEEEPPKGVGDDFYLDAFRNLSTERQVGMELGEIPWSKVVEYGLYKGLDSDMIDAFVHIIRSMDVEYMKWTAAESKKARQGSQAQEGPSAAS